MEPETINYFESFDSNILKLDICNKNIKGILDLSKFTCLEKLFCFNNRITSIINIPSTLKILYCTFNQITQLDNLPCSLEELNCCNNIITSLDNLPSKLKKLNCSCNSIKNLDYLPNKLEYLDCSSNYIQILNLLPSSIKELSISFYYFDNIDNFNPPSNLKKINCIYDKYYYIIKAKYPNINVCCEDK